MKKGLLFLLLGLLYFGCSSEDNNIETILDKLQKGSVWHIDFSEVIDEIDYYVEYDEYMRFNNTSEISELYESWIFRYPEGMPVDCYKLFNSAGVSWSIETNTEEELVLHDNIPHEEGRHIFTEENGEIIYEYKEWINGEPYLPATPIVKLTKSNVNPETELNICN